MADDNAAAADFEIPGVDNRELAKWIRSELEFDQLILEFYRDNEPSSGWIHCSYSTDQNRNQSLRAQREDGKVIYTALDRNVKVKIGYIDTVHGICPHCDEDTLVSCYCN